MIATDPAQADRFAFGENWRHFLSVLDDERIGQAQQSLRRMLGVTSLEGRRFLDVGSGSGLFSLAAYRLGATVHSFDFDPDSVGCTQELRRRYGDEERWTVERGDVLDGDYLAGLGTWDVVYSWGVLHHTGQMWRALDHVARLVAPGGQLFIAIYNDHGRSSKIWRRIKRRYNRLPPAWQTPYAVAVMGPLEVMKAGFHTLRGQPLFYVRTWTRYKYRGRGMSRWHDLIDWVGGYPFEVAQPDKIFEFFHERGFELQRMTTVGTGHGCNEFVFGHNRASGTADQ